ncbi:MAG TPA: DNA-processing protein DprA [Candidatus Limnocylindrales bacterium]|nr:DNA-processing protein DprA [Candidatus Limnocylindrales bacterium]
MLGVGPGPIEPASGRPPAWDAGTISTADRSALAVLASVTGLGPVTLARLIAVVGSPMNVLGVAAAPGGASALIEATRDPDVPRSAVQQATAAAIVDAAARQGEIVRGIERLDLRLVALADPEYPTRLRTTEFPPPLLFVRGDPRALSADHAVGIVGTRRPTDAGRLTASRIAASVARADALVVSGLAVGIDGAAHAAAVAEGRPTVAFIGGGHDRLFPRVHDRLADAIVNTGGAIVSEYAPGTEPSKGTFPRRNRLISGSSDAVVVVEAPARSGALVTASWALEQGRDCYAVPGSIDAPASAGCLSLLRDWPDLVHVVAGIPQLLEDLGLAPEVAFDDRDPERAPLVSSTGRHASPEAALGAIPARDVAVAAVLGALTRLEAAGFVVARYGRYAVAGALAGAPDRRSAA